MSELKTSDETAARLAELDRAATKAPWTAADEIDDACWVIEAEAGNILVAIQSGGDGSDVDPEIIAEARNALPSLLADRELAKQLENDALEAEHKRLLARVERVRKLHAILEAHENLGTHMSSYVLKDALDILEGKDEPKGTT